MAFLAQKNLGKSLCQECSGMEMCLCRMRRQREGHRNIVTGVAAALTPLDTLEKLGKNAQGEFGALESFVFQT